VALSQPQVGGISGLLTHSSVNGKLNILPDFNDTSLMLSMFIIPLAVQWWSVWYPGAEPGGGGYIAQRMLAAKNEKHAVGATLLFNFAHYALRPWPWILVALASIVLFPDLESIQAAFPGINKKYLGDDIAYPVMLTLLSSGWLGLVLASLIAAFMSTISTHLNWGSSYVVNDFYHRFIQPDASEQHLVLVGRVSTILLMVVAGTLALTVLENASQVFSILLLSGAGTGAIFLLRWFWWRINAWTEIVGMIVATINALVLVLFVSDEAIVFWGLEANTCKLLVATLITSLAWVITAFVTTLDSKKKLQSFVDKANPPFGWSHFTNRSVSTSMKYAILSIFIGSIGVYSALFGIGNAIYGEWAYALLFLIVFSISVILITRWWRK
ncbi:MAG: Na+:solute symporter, partial [Bacteroidota bacterium]